MTDRQQIKLTSKVIYNNNLYEQVYEPDTKKTYYLGWDKQLQTLTPIDYIENGNIKYLPIIDDLLDKQAVILPSTAIEYGTEEELEIEIESFIQTWLDISEEHLRHAAWYVRLTHLNDKLTTIPYLRALGDYGTGKTRYLDVIGGICYKPMFVGGSVRSAPIYRVIDLWRGTAIFDEFTLNKSDESEDIIQILNNGFQRGKSVLRCDTNNLEKVKAFDPFGPKILASRKEFSDKALESRCITEIMKQTPRTDLPCDLTTHFFKQRQELQNKLLMYRFRNLDEIKPDEIVNINFGHILPRIKQSLMPFTVLFQYNPEKLKKFIEYGKTLNNKLIEENATSFDGLIINQYLQMKANSEPYITAQEIRNNLVNNGDANEKLNSRTIGRHFKTLGFESTPKKWDGKTIKDISIDENKLSVLKMRYVLELPESDESQTRFKE